MTFGEFRMYVAITPTDADALQPPTLLQVWYAPQATLSATMNAAQATLVMTRRPKCWS